MAEKVQINADKLKVLDAVMQKIEKDFGKGSIMRMNSTEVNDIPVIHFMLYHGTFLISSMFPFGVSL